MKKLLILLFLAPLFVTAQTVISKPGSTYTITCYDCERLPLNLFPNMYSSGLLVRTPNGSVFVRSPYMITVSGTTLFIKDMIGFQVSFRASDAGWTSASGFLSAIKDCGCSYGGSLDSVGWTDLTQAVQDSITNGGVDTNLGNTNLTQSASNRTYNANNFNLSFNGMDSFFFNGDNADWDFSNDVRLTAGNDLDLISVGLTTIDAGAVEINSADDVLVQAVDDVSISTSTGDIDIDAFAYLRMSAFGGDIDMTVEPPQTINMVFNTSNLQFAGGTSSGANITATSGSLDVIAVDTLRLGFGGRLELLDPLPLNDSPASIPVLDQAGTGIVGYITDSLLAVNIQPYLAGSGELNWSHSSNTSDASYTQDIAGFDFSMTNLDNLNLANSSVNSITGVDNFVLGENNTLATAGSYVLGSTNTITDDVTGISILGKANVVGVRSNLTIIGDAITITGANSSETVYIGYADATKAEYNLSGQLNIFKGLGINGDFGAVGEYMAPDGSGGQSWTALPAAAGGLTVTDEFTASASQVSFTLSAAPGAKKVVFYRNGIRLSNTCYSVSGVTLTYDSSFNGGQAMQAGDRINADQ